MPQFNDKSGNPAAPTQPAVFIWLFAVAAIWHYTSSTRELAEAWFQFHPVRTPLLAIALSSAFIGALFPTRVWAVLVFAAGQLVAIYGRFPAVADHLVMEMVLHVAILLSFAWLAISRRGAKVTVEDLFRLYGPVGRWLLVVMYFFGTFHKINPGFLSIASSCAVPFVDGFPLPESITSSPVLHYAGIYGTLILEALAMLLLLSARTKYFGMLLGMSFHFAIGISQFGTLAHFSAFALSLHALFLPSTFGQRIVSRVPVPAVLRRTSGVQAATIILVTLQVAFAMHLYFSREGYLVNTLFALFGITLLCLVFLFGRHTADDERYRLKSAALPLNALPVIYFLYCMSPYLGLGTGGSLAMFSGLRTEGGISNHYLIREPLGLFHYQDEIVYVKKATNPSLRAAASDNQGIVLFDFQRHFTERETLALPVTLEIDGVSYELNDKQSVQEFVNRFFRPQSWLEKKHMSFRLVDAPQPDRCRH